MSNPIYYEAHITVAESEKDWTFESIGRKLGFRTSFFNNSKEYDRPKEWIFTAKAFRLPILENACGRLQDVLGQEGVTVLRYKIEAAVKDTKPLSQHKGFLDDA